MPADINAYALGLELQLQTKSALESLTELESHLKIIESRMVAVAPSALATTQMKKEAEATGLSALKHYELFKANQDLHRINEEMKILTDQMSSSAGFLNTEFEEQAKKMQNLKEKYFSAHEAIKDMSESENKLSLEEMKWYKQSIKNITQIDKIKEAHESLTDEYDKQIKKLDIFTPLLSQLGLSTSTSTKFLSAYNKGLLGATLAIAFLANGLKNVIAMQEMYSKTTFRALGSQQDLIESSNELRGTLGATNEQAMATFKALSEAGFRATDSISELAKANYMFSRSTGVSEGHTATYQRSLSFVGLTAHDATANLGRMSAAIRSSGMTAQEAGALIDQLSHSMLRLKFGFDPKLAQGVTESITKFAAATKATQGDINAVTTMFTNLAEQPAKLQAVLGQLNLDTTGDQFQRLNRLMEQGPEATKKFIAAQGEYGIMVMENMGLNIDAMRSIQGVGDAALKAHKSVKQFTGGFVEGADLTADFNNAMKTFKETMQRILSPILNIASTITSVLGPAIVAILTPLSMIASAIGKVISVIDKIPVVSQLFKAAIMAMVLPPIFKSIGAVPLLSKSFKGLFDVIKAGTPTLRGFTSLLTAQLGAKKLLTKETLNLAKGLLFGKTAAMTASTGWKSIVEGATASAGAVGQAGVAAQAAGGGFMSMGGGVLRAAMGLARVHPILTAVVAAVGAAMFIVPKLFEMFDSGDKKSRALATALMVILSPLIVVYTAIRAVWTIMKAFFETITDALSDAFKPLVDLWDSFSGKTTKTVSIMEIMNKAMAKLGQVAKAFFKIFSPVVWLIKGLGAIIGWVVDGIKKVINAFAPVVKFAEWAIGKISKFLGLDEEASEQVQTTAQDMRTAYEKMWGTAEQQFEAAKDQYKLAGDSMRETRALITPEIVRTVNPAYMPVTKQAEPVITPTITDKTARAKTEEFNEKMVNLNTLIKEAIEKMTTKVDNKASMAQLVELLKVWLPKIAEDKDKGGLATAANQWL